MKRADLLVTLIVFVLAAVLFAASNRGGASAGMVAVIYENGVITEKITLESERRYYKTAGNELLLEPDGATMIWADCDSQDCVHSGKITRQGGVIACLPNRVMVRLEGGSEEEYDAIAG